MSRAILEPEIVFKGGKPNAVILGIKEYEKLIEAVDAKEDGLELLDKRVKRIIKESNADFKIGKTKPASLLLALKN